jgi:hypothetical protein
LSSSPPLNGQARATAEPTTVHSTMFPRHCVLCLTINPLKSHFYFLVLSTGQVPSIGHSDVSIYYGVSLVAPRASLGRLCIVRRTTGSSFQKSSILDQGLLVIIVPVVQ